MDHLETACEGYKQLVILDSPLLKNVVKTILPTLKNHLNRYRLNSVMREEMLNIIFSKRYPSSNTKKKYEMKRTDDKNMKKFREEIGSHGRSCNSICCTGAYVAETMACVVVLSLIHI